jgi:hypothetical protein
MNKTQFEILYDDLLVIFKKEDFYPKIAHIFCPFSKIDDDTIYRLCEISDEDLDETLDVIFTWMECDINHVEYRRILAIVRPFLIKCRQI